MAERIFRIKNNVDPVRYGVPAKFKGLNLIFVREVPNGAVPIIEFKSNAIGDNKVYQMPKADLSEVNGSNY